MVAALGARQRVVGLLRDRAGLAREPARLRPRRRRRDRACPARSPRRRWPAPRRAPATGPRRRGGRAARPATSSERNRLCGSEPRVRSRFSPASAAASAQRPWSSAMCASQPPRYDVPGEQVVLVAERAAGLEVRHRRLVVAYVVGARTRGCSRQTAAWCSSPRVERELQAAQQLLAALAPAHGTARPSPRCASRRRAPPSRRGAPPDRSPSRPTRASPRGRTPSCTSTRARP